MSLHATLFLYCLAIVAASLGGGLVALLARLGHRGLQFVLSGVSGFMLGVALLHLLPHAGATIGLEQACTATLVGLLAMFLIERFFSFHHHETPAPAPGSGEAEAEGGSDGSQSAGHDHTHGHGCSHGHGHAHGHNDASPTHSPLSWTGAAIGMGLHSLLGGIALGSAMATENQHRAGWLGLSVFLVILLHKPLDALTVTALVKRSGLKPLTGHLINGLFALIVPLGAWLTVLFFGHTVGPDANPVASENANWAAYALAFSAGTFLCISLSDLLPELHFHDHDRLPLTFCLLLGIGLALGVAHLEHSMHAHDHAPRNGHLDHTGHDDGEVGDHGNETETHDHDHDHDHAH